MRYVLVAVAWLTLCLQVQANDWQTDPRLQKPVTLQLPNAPFAEILEELSKQTGVPFTIHPSLQEEKATFFVTNQPAQQILAKWFSLFGLKCEPKEDGYQLLPDPALRQQEQEAVEWERRMIRLEAEKTLRTWSQLIRDDFAVYARRASDIEEEMDKLQQEKPPGWQDRRAALAEQFAQVREVALPHQYLAGWLYRRFSSAIWRELRQGETVWFSTAQEPGTLPLPPDALRWQAYPADTTPRSMLFGIRLDQAQRDLVFYAFTQPGDDTAEPTATVYKHPLSPDPEQKPSVQQRWERWQTPPEEFSIFRRRIENKTPSPAPPPGQSTAADSLCWIAQHAQMNVIADAFRVPVRLVVGGDTLSEWLSRFTLQEPGYLRIEGNWLLFRHAGYWRLKRSELPEKLVRQMEQKWATEGLSLDDYAALAAQLTPEGIVRVRESNGYSFRFDSAPLRDAALALRFWASLSAEQKKVALQLQPLAYLSLTPVQQRLFQEAMLAKLHEKSGPLLLVFLTMPDLPVELAFVIDRWREGVYTLEGDKLSITTESIEELEQQRHLVPDAPTAYGQSLRGQFVFYFGIDSQRSVRYHISVREK
jgi:hypothetical protein